jgi:hypothetical protein
VFIRNDQVPFHLYFEFSEFFIPVSLIIGCLNLVFYSFLLYLIETNRHGVNLLTYICDPDRILTPKKNDDIIISEGSDVSDERAKVANLMNDVRVYSKKMKQFFKIIYVF